MLKILRRAARWLAIPALMIASLLTSLAAAYAPLLDALICTGTMALVWWALQAKAYYWAAAFVGVVVLFSPLLLIFKVLLLMLLTGATVVATTVALLNRQELTQE